MKDREKEIRLLIYEESQIIKHSKKRIKDLNMELAELQGEKRLNRRFNGSNRKDKRSNSIT